MNENYYLKLLLGNQDLPGVSVPFAAAPMPKAPTPPPQRKPAQEDIIPEARAPISKPAYQNPESAPSPMKEEQALVGNGIPTMKEAFQNYYESQNKIPELFMKKYEALESQRQADREELDAMKAKTFEGWRNKDLTPLMALTDSLTGSNLTRSYKAPTAEAENKAKIAAMENYLRKNAGQLSDVEIMAGKQDALNNKAIYDTLRQEGLDKENAAYKQGIISARINKTSNSSSPKPEKLNGDKWKAATFAQRMNQAENIMNDIISKHGKELANYKTSLLRSSGVEGIKPDWLKKFEQAEKNFINAQLRRESGAAIGKEEFANAREQYIPQWGDSPEVLENKRKNRLLSFSGMKAESGAAYEKVSEEYNKQTSQEPGVKIVRNEVGEEFEIESEEELQDALAQGFKLIGK